VSCSQAPLIDKQINFCEKNYAWIKKNYPQTILLLCILSRIQIKAYADGLSIDNKGNKSTRNAPTLINAVFQKSFFLDGRSQTLTEQISEVFFNKDEFNTEIHQFSIKF
jgi:cytochrome c peroxidase